jgi:hypothetical protein
MTHTPETIRTVDPVGTRSHRGDLETAPVVAAPTPAARRGRRVAAERWTIDADLFAALVCGAMGLFLFNAILGPIAIALGVESGVHARKARWRRLALVAVVLGVADLFVVLAILLPALHHGHLTWHLGV